MHLFLPAGFIVAIGGILPAFAIGLIGAKAVEGYKSRNPEAGSKSCRPCW